jgi:uncharacterized protein (DUF1501 family)
MIGGRRASLASPQRRRLLKSAAATMLLATARSNVALADASDYKALVCIYLEGGNDGENTLIRYDNAGYQAYAAIRTVASGINIPQAQLLPIQPATLPAPFGFHPACAPLKSLFDAKQLAVVANMGILVQPSTKFGLEAQAAPRPANLFSHSDQALAQQSADPAGFTRVGWGGRVADRLDAAYPENLFPSLISTNGMKTFASGTTSIPLTVPEYPYFALHASGDNQAPFDALREGAMREILAQSSANIYDRFGQLLSQDGLNASSVVQPILQAGNSVVAPYFANLNSSIARQLRMIATLIEGRAQTGLKRQVFFAQQWGYDTHGSQPPIHHGLLSELSLAIKAFQDAMSALGTAGNVTTFTLSDFGRTLKPASNVGTDHGWGNYAFVIGGAVKGGDFYGKVATQALNGPDDLGTDGRWIPTTSLEQYGATLARWLGISEGDLPYIFPNIGAFPNTNLGFMA